MTPKCYKCNKTWKQLGLIPRKIKYECDPLSEGFKQSENYFGWYKHSFYWAFLCCKWLKTNEHCVIYCHFISFSTQLIQ